MRAIIVDDQAEHTRQLRNLLNQYCKQVLLIGEAINGSEAGALILAKKPDLIFLDVQMPGESGFDLLQSLGDYDFQVIFITGYDQYAIQAIRCSALDYLLKPVNAGELVTAVLKAEKKIKQSNISLQLDNLLNIVTHPKEDHKIALPVAKGHRFVNPKDIIYLEASNNYTHFKLAGSEAILISKGLYKFEEILHSFGFVRCHASYIVNPTYVQKFFKALTGLELLLTNNESVPVTTMYVTSVKEALGLKRKGDPL